MGKGNLSKRGLSIKALEDLTIGDLKKLDKEFRKKDLKVPNVKLVKSYGKEAKL